MFGSFSAQFRSKIICKICYIFSFFRRVVSTTSVSLSIPCLFQGIKGLFVYHYYTAMHCTGLALVQRSYFTYSMHWIANEITINNTVDQLQNSYQSVFVIKPVYNFFFLHWWRFTLQNNSDLYETEMSSFKVVIVIEAHC